MRPRSAAGRNAVDAARKPGRLNRVGRALTAVEAALAQLASLVLVCVMLIVAADVAMRYVFHRPFGWSYDLVSLYLLPAILYLALPYAFFVRVHVSVDIVQQYIGARGRHLSDLVTATIAAALFGFIAYLGATHTAADFSNGAITTGDIDLPTWLSDVLVPIGSGLLALRLLLTAIAHLLVLGGNEASALDLLPLDDAAAPRGAGH